MQTKSIVDVFYNFITSDNFIEEIKNKIKNTNQFIIDPEKYNTLTTYAGRAAGYLSAFFQFLYIKPIIRTIINNNMPNMVAKLNDDLKKKFNDMTGKIKDTFSQSLNEHLEDTNIWLNGIDKLNERVLYSEKISKLIPDEQDFLQRFTQQEQLLINSIMENNQRLKTALQFIYVIENTKMTWTQVEHGNTEKKVIDNETVFNAVKKIILTNTENLKQTLENEKYKNTLINILTRDQHM